MRWRTNFLLTWLILVWDFHLGYVQFCLTWRSICCNFLGAGFMFHIGQVVGLYVSAMFLYICQLCWLFTIYIFQALFCMLSIHCCHAKCRYTFCRTIEEMFVALSMQLCVNNNTTLSVFVFVFVQSVSNWYCTIWSVCAASHLTLRDSEWRVNLGPACRCHTWTSPCLPSTWEPLFCVCFLYLFLYLFSTHILKSRSR